MECGKSIKKKYGHWNDKNNPYMKLIPYFSLFLDTYSESSRKNIYLKIVDLALYCKNNFNKSIVEMDGYDVINYFKNVIDKKDISTKTKGYYRYFISSYFNYVKKFKKDMDHEKFHNPVPSKKIWDFNPGPKHFALDIEQTFLTIDLIEKIMHHVYYYKPAQVYIVLSLIVYTGARISEILHLELKNIDLKNRWLMTEVKSKRNNKRNGIYFFPEFFLPELQHHVKLLKEEHENPKYLFPSRISRVNGKHITPRLIQKYLRTIKEELGIEAKMNPHAFRDFLNTKRFEKGCPEAILKFLLNQTVRDVNTNHYLKKYKNRLKLRDLYDQYSPFEKLLKPNPSL